MSRSRRLLDIRDRAPFRAQRGSSSRTPRRRTLRVVSARSLHARPLRLTDRTLERASVLPFFDGDGDTHWLLLAVSRPPRLVLLEWRPGLIRKPLLGRARLDLAWSGLADANHEQARSVARCWHFDPWWLLTRAPFVGHPAAEPLPATNAVEALRPVDSLHYASDLSRVVWLTETAPEGPRLRKWNRGQLPTSPGASPRKESGARSRGWRLDPFWQR